MNQIHPASLPNMIGMHAFSKALVEWYIQNKRDLPWRKTKNPYYIWLSEVILQQTRVEQGLPYYLRFVETFPRLQDLAQAKDDEVMKLWQGLGYYSRARNMLTTARIVWKDYGGEFPALHSQILGLKGIGDYTAAAISSISFDLPYAVVDGNVQRVLSRVFNESTPVNSTQGKKVFASLAKSLLPESNAGTFNQAVMELGALVCTPQKPLCQVCPVATFCLAKQEGTWLDLPRKLPKTKVQQRILTYLVPNFDHQTLVRLRTGQDIYKGLYEFPLLEGELDPEQLKTFACSLGKIKSLGTASKVYRHLLSHRDIRCQFVTVEYISLEHSPFEKIEWSKFSGLPISKLIDRWWEDHKGEYL
ncbi:MAG: A/G-specific adenine glycosylase [Bacteroidia bacterium]|nr:A/G-specific adenine glycosylase [Bacteroidia bacterium]